MDGFACLCESFARRKSVKIAYWHDANIDTWTFTMSMDFPDGSFATTRYVSHDTLTNLKILPNNVVLEKLEEMYDELQKKKTINKNITGVNHHD